jgi:hypothetical protein
MTVMTLTSGGGAGAGAALLPLQAWSRVTTQRTDTA